MKNINKRTEFDRQWEDAFKDAERNPSEGVWDKIDSALSKEEAGYFKKRAFLYKLLAAASIAFALGVGIFSINYYLGNNSEQIAVQNNGSNNNSDISNNDKVLPLKIESQNPGQAFVESQIPSENEETLEDATLTQVDNQELVPIEAELKSSVLLNNEDSDTPDNYIDRDYSQELLSLNKIQAKGISLSSREEMIYEVDHIYLIPIMPRGSSKKNKEKESGLFLAGLDFSTGVFDPNFQQGGSVFASSGNATYADARVESFDNQLASFNTANKAFAVVRSTGTETQPEVVFSYGANVGYKLTRRIIIQTGIAYRKANTTTTTTGYAEQIGSGTQIPIVAAYQYQLDGLSLVESIAETNLSNQYEFASIPFRAGYVVLDKKFNLALMAGISSEFFLGNQIVDKSNNLETLSTSPGDGSPFKSVYFNGSLGTMLGYTFAKSYVLTLEPSYR
ncbi:MAG: hypothetical protein KAI29_05675, partial [Cyclobacteriaceae bacterium]|nr:hypothetical protein [Cyclobacteriaceae bacterium]